MNPADFSPWHGVFETLRVVEGRPLFLAEHEASLRESAATLGLGVTANLAARASSLAKQTGRWRWVVTRDGAFDFFNPEDVKPSAEYAILLAPQRLGSQNWDARYKTLSYLTHTQARQWARNHGADEAILLNENAQLASAAMANLFWVRGSKIFTPALEAGCRNGVIRQWILANEKVEQGLYPAADLDQADEIFLTNSLIGIMPVTSCGKRLHKPGARTCALQKRYAEYCQKRAPTRAKTGSESSAAR
jgi:branched-subunit amino acid aminotransferase/4-amino-4-deoxychorismate lyase